MIGIDKMHQCRLPKIALKDKTSPSVTCQGHAVAATAEPVFTIMFCTQVIIVFYTYLNY